MWLETCNEHDTPIVFVGWDCPLCAEKEAATDLSCDDCGQKDDQIADLETYIEDLQSLLDDADIDYPERPWQ